MPTIIVLNTCRDLFEAILYLLCLHAYVQFILGVMTENEPKKKKYLCCFNDRWCKEEGFKIWLRKVDDVTAECSLCYHSFSVKYEGTRALVIYAESQKHKYVVEQQKRTPQLSSFLVKRDSSQENLIIAAKVGQLYHSVSHHLSYASLDCGNKLLPNIYPDSDIARKSRAVGPRIVPSQRVF